MSEFDEIKLAAGKFMQARKLNPKTPKGYEALLGFYVGWYRGEDLPPYVTICFACGRQDELMTVPS